MPCTYSVVNLRDREREKELAQAAEEEKKREILRKKKSLLTALIAMGFEVDANLVKADQTLITGTKEE